MSELGKRIDEALHSRGVWTAIGVALVVLGFWILIKGDQYNGCLRGTADRNANALSWDQAYIARRSTWVKESPGPHTEQALEYAARAGEPNARAAVQYRSSAADLRTRTRPTEEGRAKLCRVLVSYWPWQ